jgi:hypothetical protein
VERFVLITVLLLVAALVLPEIRVLCEVSLLVSVLRFVEITVLLLVALEVLPEMLVEFEVAALVAELRVVLAAEDSGMLFTLDTSALSTCWTISPICAVLSCTPSMSET